MDGLLLDEAQSEKDEFLLFRYFVVLSPFDSCSGHLLNKCNKRSILKENIKYYLLSQKN